MNSTSTPDSALRVRDLVLLALLGALMMGTKLALAALPNVHLVTVLLFFAVLLFGRGAFGAVFVYVLLEGLVFGFGLWWVSYLYIWPLTTCVALLLRRSRSWLLWAVAAGFCGLSFGALCALPYLFLGGVGTAFAYWVSGIPFDLVHGASNFALTLVLLPPLFRLGERLMRTNGA